MGATNFRFVCLLEIYIDIMPQYDMVHATKCAQCKYELHSIFIAILIYKLNVWLDYW